MSQQLTSSTAIAAAKLTAIVSSAVLAGSAATYSFLLVPAIESGHGQSSTSSSDSERSLLQQWRVGYIIGYRATPPQCLISGLSWGYLAFLSPASSLKRYLYLSAAILVPSILPYTLTLQRPVNGALTRRAERLGVTSEKLGDGEDKTAETYGRELEISREVEEGRSTVELVEAWKWFNLVRAGIVGVGTVLGGWAAVAY